MSGAKLEGGKSVLHIGAQTRPLRGELSLPGDKSISHRALIFSALAEGESVLTGLSTGADVGSTRRVLSALGVAISGEAPGPVRVKGAGVGGLRPPADGAPIDCGNSGTTVRLLAGAVVQGPGRFVFVGDASLSTRPMGRIASPLQAMGARVETGAGGGLPLTLEGPVIHPLAHESSVASAQVKSCVLIAGLALSGETSFTAPAASRDHSERLLRAMGCSVEESDGGRRVALMGPADPLAPVKLRVPGDPSSAAFPLVAAILVPGSEIHLEGILGNSGRLRYLHWLLAMGAKVSVEEGAPEAGEPLVALHVTASTGSSPELRGVEIPAAELPSLIDEVPILAVAAAFARGTTIFRGAGELRHKESDRLKGTTDLLATVGGMAWVEGDDLYVEGGGLGLASRAFEARGDHRLAMAGAVLAMLTGGGHIQGAEAVVISYPEFASDLADLGVTLEEVASE